MGGSKRCFQRAIMPSILLTAPAVEPVTLDEARAFLRVEHNADDEVVAAPPPARVSM